MVKSLYEWWRNADGIQPEANRHVANDVMFTLHQRLGAATAPGQPVMGYYKHLFCTSSLYVLFIAIAVGA